MDDDTLFNILKRNHRHNLVPQYTFNLRFKLMTEHPVWGNARGIYVLFSRFPITSVFSKSVDYNEKTYQTLDLMYNPHVFETAWSLM